MKRPQIVITDHLTEAGIEQSLLQDLADVQVLQAKDEAEALRRSADADVLLVFHHLRWTAASLEQLPRCRAIIRCGVGYDNVDLEAAGRLGIVVCNVPDYGTEEVADHALMLLLALVRRLRGCDLAIRSGRWNASDAAGAPRLRGQTLGLIGCGRIGMAMALRGKALSMRVMYYDPGISDGLDKALGIERAYTLEELLPQSRFLSLHCPLTPQTHHLLNARTLAMLPHGAYLVNTARGGVIDSEALFAALQSGRVAFAGLDVEEHEPTPHEGLRTHPHVLWTPHTAFYSVESIAEMRMKAAHEARRVLLGEPVRNPVNASYLITPPRASENH
ncbi:MAG: C-terminal binding protein [Gemmataceae bacterium]